MQSSDHSEFLQSDLRGFTDTYRCVAKDYAIEDGLIRPIANGKPVSVYALPRVHEAIRETYMPMSRPELPTEFAKVADGSEEQVLRFVRRYGLLGYAGAFLTTLEIYQRFQQEVSDAQRDELEIPTFCDSNFNARLRSGEPVSWIINHAQTVKFVLELNEVLTDKGRLRSKLEQLTTEKGNVEFRYAHRGMPYLRIVDIRNVGDEKTTAQTIIARIVTDNLNGGVSRQLVLPQDATKNPLLSVFYPNSLIDGIYWHLADAIYGGTVKRCLFCGKFFNATHLKRSYCPPPMGLSGEGPCAQNDRAKRSRSRAKAKLEKPRKQKQKGSPHGRISSRKSKG